MTLDEVGLRPGFKTAVSKPRHHKSETSTTDSAWDSVSGGGIPLNINDATTTTSGTTDTSYLYGNLLFGGTAPLEQITTTSAGTSVSFLVSNQTGVQGVYSGNSGSLGAVQEMAIYSVYGVPTISSGTNVTPFGFQGSYTDPTGLIYLINRYYDPATDQFLSIDPDVATTDQPYVFVNDDSLNATDPLGLALPGFLRDLIDIPQDMSYVIYWGSYETIKGAEKLANKCGVLKDACKAASEVLTDPLVASEAAGLGGNAVADLAKGETIWQNDVKKQPLFGNQTGGVALSKAFDKLFGTKVGVNMTFPGFNARTHKIDFKW